MDFDALLERVLGSVDRKAFTTPVVGIGDPEEVELLRPIFDALSQENVSIPRLRHQVQRLRSEGLVTPRRAVILLQTLAAHPACEDHAELARLIGEEHHLVLKEGGPHLASRLAVVDHHRAVHAFLLARYDVALELETRSVEACPWGDSLANILIILLRLNQEPRARALLQTIRETFPTDLRQQVEHYIEQDPDLALLRDEWGAGRETPISAGPVPASHFMTEEGPPCDSILH